MNLDYFPNFIRSIFKEPEIQNMPNEEMEELGIAFKSYPEENFKGKEDKLELIWDISPKSVIKRIATDPFAMNGYSPGLILHFTEFVRKNKEETDENPS